MLNGFPVPEVEMAKKLGEEWHRKMKVSAARQK
jgi:hypothetical protein